MSRGLRGHQPIRKEVHRSVARLIAVRQVQPVRQILTVQHQRITGVRETAHIPRQAVQHPLQVHGVPILLLHPHRHEALHLRPVHPHRTLLHGVAHPRVEAFPPVVVAVVVVLHAAHHPAAVEDNLIGA